MDILVTGGTGFIGTALCRELADRGHDVTAMARTPEADGVPDGVDAVAGDVTDYDDIEPAFADQDVVVNLVALSPLFKPDGGDRMHEVVHVGGTRNVVRAAEAHDLEAIVQMSGLGADPDAPTAYLQTKGEAEGIVRESGLDWTIFRPSLVFGEGAELVPFTKLLTTPFVTALPGGGRTRFQPIFLGDLVPMLADAAVDPDRRGEVYELGGPEVLTLADITELVYEAEGSSTTVLPIPMSLAKIGLSLADPLPVVPFGRDQYRSLTVDNVPEHNDVDAFGVDEAGMTTLGSFLGADRTI